MTRKNKKAAVITSAQSATSSSKWSHPQCVTDLDIAFPCNTIGLLLPTMEEIPLEFHTSKNPWCKIVSDLFFRGGRLPASREGIDRICATRHIKAVLGSMEPRHEHKEAGTAYLMSLWYQIQ